MRLIIARHGETFENQKGFSQGHYNSQLNPKGKEQAKRVALALKDEKITVAYCSDLDRAANTMKEILVFHPNVKPVLLKELREQKKGIYENRHHDIIRKAVSDLKVPYHEFYPEEGESMKEVWNKSKAFFKMLKDNHSKDTILVVSHGGPISCLLAHIHGNELEDFDNHIPFKNTTVTIIDFDDSFKPKFKTFDAA